MENEHICTNCSRVVPAPYRLNDSARCLRCSVQDRQLVRRSLTIAAVVGTFLVAINQGNRLLDGSAGADLYWKIPLTYFVPYVVATVSALLNARE